MTTASHDTQMQLTDLLEYAVDNRSVPVLLTSQSVAMTLTLDGMTLYVEGGERIWLRKDSVNECYVTLEDQNAQLTVTRLPTGMIRVTKRPIGSTRSRRSRVASDINIADTFNNQ